MKKIILSIFTFLSVYLNSQVICPPTPVRFQNTDLLQIWCRLNNATVTVTGGSIVVTSGSVVVTNTVPVNVLNTLTVSGNVGGYSKKVHYSVPTSTTAYSVGDCVGGDIFIGPSLTRIGNNGPFIVYEVCFFDSTGHTPDLDVTFLSYPYSANVDNTPTQFTNDDDRYLGNVHINSSDWTVTGTTSRVSKSYIGIICMGIELYAVITTNTAFTLPATTGFNMKIGVFQD